MNSIERVFFHELGHFVAREINHRYYNGTKVKAINIYPCGNDDDYCGGIDVELPSGHDGVSRPPPRIRLAENLAGTVYGCFFQSFISNNDLQEVRKVNGEDDKRKRASFIYANHLMDYEMHMHDAECAHFASLMDRKELEGFKKINPHVYLIPGNNGCFQVDIEKLRIDLNGLIENHSHSYSDLINKYNAIIDKAE